MNPGSVAPQSKPWTVRPCCLHNCSPSGGTAGYRSSMADSEQLFVGAEPRTTPGLLPSQQSLQDTHREYRQQVCHTGSKSGTSQKMGPGVHYQFSRGLEGMARACCRGEQLFRVRVLWPLRRLSLPAPEASTIPGTRGKGGATQHPGPAPEGHDHALLWPPQG